MSMIQRLSDNELKINNTIFTKTEHWWKCGIDRLDNSLFCHGLIQEFLYSESATERLKFDIHLNITLVDRSIYYERDKKNHEVFIPEEGYQS